MLNVYAVLSPFEQYVNTVVHEHHGHHVGGARRPGRHLIGHEVQREHAEAGLDPVVVVDDIGRSHRSRVVDDDDCVGRAHVGFFPEVFLGPLVVQQVVERKHRVRELHRKAVGSYLPRRRLVCDVDHVAEGVHPSRLARLVVRMALPLFPVLDRGWGK